MFLRKSPMQPETSEQDGLLLIPGEGGIRVVLRLLKTCVHRDSRHSLQLRPYWVSKP